MNIDIRISDREPTLADLIKALAGNDRLSATRRRDLISAVNTTARLANRRPEEIAANARELRERLARLHLTHVNMKPNRASGAKAAASYQDMMRGLRREARRKTRARRHIDGDDTLPDVAE